MRSSVASSAHCTSSSNSSVGVRPSADRTRGNSDARRTSGSPSPAPTPSSSATSISGPSARGVAPASHEPTRNLPRPATRCANSKATDVLPAPPSPPRNTNRPRPASASAQYEPRVTSGASRSSRRARSTGGAVVPGTGFEWPIPTLLSPIMAKRHCIPFKDRRIRSVSGRKAQPGRHSTPPTHASWESRATWIDTERRTGRSRCRLWVVGGRSLSRSARYGNYLV